SSDLGQLIFSVISCIGILAILPFVRKVWVLPIIYSFAQGSATLFLVLFSRQFLSFQWKWNKTTKEMGKQFFLLIGSYGITHVSMLLDNAFASLLPSGMVTALNYGYAIGMMPSSLLYFGNIGIVSLSENHASQKKTKQYLFFLAIYSLPFIALTWLLLTPVLKVFLEYGRFSNLDLNLTAKAAKYYILSLPFIMIFSILAKAFQIKNKLHLLCTILALGCLVNFFLKYLFVVVLQWHLVAIPLSTLFVNIFVCAVGYVLFRKVSEEKSLSG
ncbi:MAG: polysaccharide biosynthesis C-terminal domain-containing protein, partial [Candidatus Eremiobacteraeota bacterium]|nr:polysaccharide biosynthesis C-terminal domain-containing protein [Candidatus Eremiobacteraeota bacterium]